MKSRIINISIILLCSYISVLTYSNWKLRSELDSFNLEVSVYRELQNDTDMKRVEFEASSHHINIPLDSISSIIDSISFIYVYADTQCRKCITGDIALIRRTLGIEHIVIIPVVENSRSNNAILHSDLYDLKFIRLNYGAVVFPKVNGLEVRFMGVVNVQGELISSFSPSISNENQKKQYLEFVKNNYHFE